MANDLETRFTAELFKQYSTKQNSKKVLSYQKTIMKLWLAVS